MPTEEQVNELNSHRTDYYVKKSMGTVVAGEQDGSIGDPLPFDIGIPVKGSSAVLRVDSGFLVGIDNGEWGGRVIWYSPAGDSSYVVSRDQVSQFVRRGDRIFAIEGLAHLSMSEGNIIELRKNKGAWVAEVHFQLPDAPAGIDVDTDGSFIVLTYASLLHIDQEKHMTSLVSNAIWRHGIWPTSLVINDGYAYLGMRAGVTRYHLKKGTLEWLQP